MNNIRVNNSQQNLSLRTQELLQKYSARKNERTAEKGNFNEIIAKISKETESRINNLHTKVNTPAKENSIASTLNSSSSPNGAVSKTQRWSPTIIPTNVETKVSLGETPAEKIKTQSDTLANNSMPVDYKKAIEELAAKYKINEKYQNKDVTGTVTKIASQKLTSASGKAMEIRSDLPTVSENYEVKKGDTLAGIAKKFYNDPFMFKSLAVVNNKQAPYKLTEGQNLRIMFHQVKMTENDTLQNISEKYTGGKVTPKTLAKINEGTEFKAGATLLVPVQLTPVKEEVQTATTKNTSAAVDSKDQIEKFASQIEKINM